MPRYAASGTSGLAYILVAKLLRKQVPPNARDIYSSFIKTAEMREQVTANKRSRGRKIISTDKGEVYDLSAIFDKLNRKYFRGGCQNLF